MQSSWCPHVFNLSTLQLCAGALLSAPHSLSEYWSLTIIQRSIAELPFQTSTSFKQASFTLMNLIAFLSYLLPPQPAPYSLKPPSSLFPEPSSPLPLCAIVFTAQNGALSQCKPYRRDSGISSSLSPPAGGAGNAHGGGAVE